MAWDAQDAKEMGEAEEEAAGARLACQIQLQSEVCERESVCKRVLFRESGGAGAFCGVWGSEARL